MRNVSHFSRTEQNAPFAGPNALHICKVSGMCAKRADCISRVSCTPLRISKPPGSMRHSPLQRPKHSAQQMLQTRKYYIRFTMSTAPHICSAAQQRSTRRNSVPQIGTMRVKCTATTTCAPKAHRLTSTRRHQIRPVKAQPRPQPGARLHLGVNLF